MTDRYFFRRAYRKLLRPWVQKPHREPTPIEPQNIPGPALFLLAHPDDEVFCSGLILYLRKHQIPAHIVCFTRGEGGDRGVFSDDCNLAQLREDEMSESAQILGASSITFLEYEDPPPPPGKLYSPPVDTAAFQKQLLEIVQKLGIRLLVSHGSSGEYWHPAHLELHAQAKLLAQSQPSLAFWTMNAWVPNHPLDRVINQDDQADLILDAKPYEEQRIASLTAHRSQLEVFETFVGGSIRDYIHHTQLEAYRRVLE